MKIQAELLDLYKITVHDCRGDGMDEIGVVYESTFDEAYEKALRCVYSKNWQIRLFVSPEKVTSILYDGKYYDVSSVDIDTASTEYKNSVEKFAELKKKLNKEQLDRISAMVQAALDKRKEQERIEKLEEKARHEQYEKEEYERLKKKYG